MSSIYEFGGAPTAASFALKVLPGMLACAAVLAVVRASAGHGLLRLMRTPVPAFLASLGTLLAVVPEFAQVPVVPVAGGVCAGFFFLFVLAQWGLAFARLDQGRILGLSGASFFAAALVAFAVSWMPLNAAALTTSLLPLVGFAFLHRLPTPQECGQAAPKAGGTPAAHIARGRDTLALGSLPWKTFAGLFSIFFAYNGIVATHAVETSWLGNADVTFLVLPALLALAFIVLGRTHADARSLSLVAKGGLAAVTLPFMLASCTVEVPEALAFADGLAMYTASWAILVLAAKDATSHAGEAGVLAAFCLGWFAQTLGGFLSYAVAPLAQASEMLYLFLMVAFVIVAGVEFFSDLGAERGDDGGVREGAANSEEEGEPVGTSPHTADTPTTPAPAGPAPAPTQADARSEAFCREHGLSAREAEVFALWVTGHGVRDITSRLSMSESTAKTHVRHIYDKCGVYGKANLLAAYEEWLAGQAR